MLQIMDLMLFSETVSHMDLWCHLLMHSIRIGFLVHIFLTRRMATWLLFFPLSFFRFLRTLEMDFLHFMNHWKSLRRIHAKRSPQKINLSMKWPFALVNVSHIQSIYLSYYEAPIARTGTDLFYHFFLKNN